MTSRFGLMVGGFAGGAVGATLAESVHLVAPEPRGGAIVYLHTATWMALVAAPIALSIRWAISRLGQHNRPSLLQCLVALSMGLLGGAVAGTLSQAIYNLFEDEWIKDIVIRTICWGMFSLVLAVFLSLFLPNLPKSRAALLGLAGGILGGVTFRASLELDITDFHSRLLGGATIGAFIALSITVARTLGLTGHAFLEITFGPAESLSVPLGASPVSFGGSPNDTVFVRGLDGKALTILVRNEDVVAVQPHERDAILADGSTIAIGNVTVTVVTGPQSAPA